MEEFRPNGAAGISVTSDLNLKWSTVVGASPQNQNKGICSEISKPVSQNTIMFLFRFVVS